MAPTLELPQGLLNLGNAVFVENNDRRVEILRCPSHGAALDDAKLVFHLVSLRLRSVLLKEALRVEQSSDWCWEGLLTLVAFEFGGHSIWWNNGKHGDRVDGFKYPEEPRAPEGGVAGRETKEAGLVGSTGCWFVSAERGREDVTERWREGRVPSEVLTTSFDSSVVVWMLALPARAVVGSRAE